MGLKSELEKEVDDIFFGIWETRVGREVPSPEDVKLGNFGVELDATVLYADLADSTDLVDKYSATFAAEVYKAFLKCAVRIINANDGTITAFDGDRVMAVFIGTDKSPKAVRAAMQIKWAVDEIINPKLSTHPIHKTYSVKHVVGIDCSSLLAARTGIKGTNDLVWVGRAANYAAKLSSYSSIYSTYITQRAYDELNDGTKYSSANWMWSYATALRGELVLRSNYKWVVG